MNQPETVGSNESQGQSSSSAGASPVGSPLTFVQLYLDCFEELFEYLPIRELLALRQTCKRMKKVVDVYIKEFHPAVAFGFGLIELVPKNAGKYQNLSPNDVNMIKQVAIRSEDFRKGKFTSFFEIENVKQILGQVETVNIDFMSFYEEKFYDKFLKHCPKIKKLSIAGVDVDRNCGTEWEFEWLVQQYPHLETLEMKRFDLGCPMGTFSIHEFKQFFPLNPNFRVLTIPSIVLPQNDYYLKHESFEVLNLMVQMIQYQPDIDAISEILHKWYERGCYKRLNIYAFESSDDEIDYIIDLPAIEKFYFESSDEMANIPPLPPSIKEIGFGGVVDFSEAEMLTSKLAYVERIYLKRAGIKNIMPFVASCPRVKKIRIVEFQTENGENGPIDIAALNAERERGLSNSANKITIYVDERNFLATKWAAMPTDCSMVQLKRHTASKWEHVEFKKIVEEEERY